MLNKTEILAPAGNFDAVKAAVNAHADAIYLGGSLFSARAFAGNFNEKELLETIDYCHLFDVKVYMAINTLLKNDEIKRLPEYVEPYYCEGVDGIIVQDMGVVNILSNCFPDLPLHGSTQLSVSSEYGAAFLKSMGMTRFVPSRELSLDEIKSIKKNVDIEVETFVHGAMCYCYSGRCLMSSYAGGRSGNRGRCAQPCRKKYTMDNNQAYMLSLKDMCMLQDIGMLIDAGIDSFKIEGRMKKPEYVAATTYAYRELRDAYISGQKDITRLASEYENKLKDIYNRGGFYSGYYFTGNGRSMLADKRPNHTGLKVGKVTGIEKPYVQVKLCENVNAGDVFELRGPKGDVELTCGQDAASGKNIKIKGKSFNCISAGSDVYRTRNNKLLKDIQSEIINNERKILLRAEVTAKIGEKIRLRLEPYQKAESGQAVVEVEGPECMMASKTPVNAHQIMEKIRKTGGTIFEIADIEADVDHNLFVQIGALNSLRRQALEVMEDKLASMQHRSESNIQSILNLYDDCENNKHPDNVMAHNDIHSGVTVSISDAAHVNIVKKYKWINNVIVDYNIRKYGAELMDAGFITYIALPEILRQKKLGVYGDLQDVLMQYDGVVIRNLDELGYLVKHGYTGKVIADASLYTYNDYAHDFFKKYISDACFIASNELTLSELDALEGSYMLKIYGHQKVMITANCIAGNYCQGCVSGGSDRPIKITDDMGNIFWAVNHCSDCYNIIYNGVPTSLLDKNLVNNVYMEFSIEDSAAVENIMNYMECSVNSGNSKMECPVKDYTRGHYYKEID